MAQQHDCATTNKQTHKLEFYLNIRETTPKRTNLSPRFKKKKTISSFPPLLISPENSRNLLGASFLRQSFLTDTGCATGNNNWTRSWIMTTCCGQFQQAYVLPNRGQPSISTFVERVLIVRQTELVSRCPCARTVSLLHPVVFIDSFRAEWETSVHRICTDSS